MLLDFLQEVRWRQAGAVGDVNPSVAQQIHSHVIQRVAHEHTGQVFSRCVKKPRACGGWQKAWGSSAQGSTAERDTAR